MGIEEAVIEGRLQVGDKIRITNAWGNSNHYKNGDTLTISRVTNSGNTITPGGVLILRSEFNIIGRRSCCVMETETNAINELVGKYVKFGGDGLDITGGELYEIEDVSPPDFGYARDTIAVYDDVGDYHRFEYPVVDYEVVEAVKVVESLTDKTPRKFTEGDLVRIKEYQSGFNVGTIAEVASFSCTSKSVVTKAVQDGIMKDWYLASTSCIELVAPVDARVDRVE